MVAVTEVVAEVTDFTDVTDGTEVTDVVLVDLLLIYFLVVVGSYLISLAKVSRS